MMNNLRVARKEHYSSKPEKLAAHGLSVVDVVNVLSKEDLRIAPSESEENELTFPYKAGGGRAIGQYRPEDR